MKSTSLLIALSTLLLGACAAKMSKDECRTVDWRTVGYEDGVAGQPGDRIGEHRRACAEYGVTPDLNAYLAGRTAGLREYCQPHNGYRAGANGYTYFDTCPADLAEASKSPTTRGVRSMCGSAASRTPNNRSRTSVARSGGSRIGWQRVPST